MTFVVTGTAASGAPIQDEKGRQLRFRLPADPATLDWNLAQSSHETHIIMNIMEGLVEQGPDMVPRPALADRWEISPDGKIYTFHLRPNLKWSDGRPLRAADFRDSWLRLLDPKTKAAYANFLFDVENAQAFHGGTITDPAAVGIRPIGDHKLEIRLNKIVPYFLHIPTFWVTFPIRADLIQKHGTQWATPGKIVTLGPYRLAEWKKGRFLELQRNSAYQPAPGSSVPAVSEVRAVVEPHDEKARALFAAGKLDFLLDATTTDLLQSKNAFHKNRVTSLQFPYLATTYLGFNVRKPELRNASVRRALTAAVDRESIATALKGGQVPARCWIPPGMAGHRATDLSTPETVFKARATLAQAGFPDGKGFPKLSLWLQKLDGATSLAGFLVQSFRQKLGIEVEAHIANPGEFQQAVAGGEASIFVGHWGADFPDPANFFEVFASSSGSNRTGWRDKDYDRWLELASATLDMNSRLTAYAAAEKILLERDVVIFPLFFKRNSALVGTNVKNLQITPLNYLFLKAVRLEP